MSANLMPVGVPDIVQRYLNGESLQALAAEHGVAHRTIYNWLLRECGEQYEDVVTQALVARIADADLALSSATDQLQIARSREQAKFARMDFERRRPKLYGQKVEASVDTQIHVHIAPLPVSPTPSIDRSTAQVIDITPDSDHEALRVWLADESEGK